MNLTSSFDDLTVERLRAVGGLKWTKHPDSVGAFVAEMDFGTAPEITTALHATVDAGLLGYLPQHLCERMGVAFSTFSAERYGWQVDPDRVRPLADVAAGLVAAISFFSAPGAPVIIPTPAYMPFLWVPQTLGREIIEVPMAREDDRYVYDLDALDRAFGTGANLLVLVNPHNPIGRVLQRGEMEAISEVVERHGGRVFSDEIHAPLVYDGHHHVPYASISGTTAAHTVTAASASKAWNLPGLKCAQLVLSNDADAAIWAEKGLMAEHGASTPGVVANCVAYEQGGPWLADVLGYLDRNRHRLEELVGEHLPGASYTPPEGTYLAWLDCRDLGLGDQPAEVFAGDAKVAMTDGSDCGQAGRGFVRYNFATPAPVLEQTMLALGRTARRRTNLEMHR